jgi:hypothetical protein
MDRGWVYDEAVPRYRIANRLQYTTFLPRDVAVNTFTFSCEEEDLPAMAQGVINFYNSVATSMGQSNSIASYIGAIVGRGPNQASVTAWNLYDPEPRAPVHYEEYQLSGTSSGDGLPLEVAACASFEGLPESGVNQARRRGRIFIGPLKTSAGTLDGANPPRLKNGFMSDVCAAMEGLHAWTLTEGGVWLVESRVDPSLVTPVVRGWVDNDFDTQRRRSPRATSRTTWSV